MSAPSAKVVADSVSPAGHRVTTLEVVLHRFVLAEFNTHRVFSRNSASSRAIPLRKQLERVRTDLAFPVSWPREQAGMQGGDELSEREQDHAKGVWWDHAAMAARRAELLGALGLHKSVANRLLEPFLWHTVVVTATAWENFFRQRCSPLAQPEIRAAAEAMRAALEASEPRQLQDGEWHLPYLDGDTAAEVTSSEPDSLALLPRISAARCARVSYLTQDGRRDYEEDLALYERLVAANPPHWSPLEHVARPWAWNTASYWIPPDTRDMFVGQRTAADVPGGGIGPVPKVGNLLGWRQLRLDKELKQEAKTYS